MNTGARLAGFGLVLAAALGGGLGIGTAAGPLGPGVRTVETPPGDTGGHGTDAPATIEDDHGMQGPAQSAPPTHSEAGHEADASDGAASFSLAGLSPTQAGYSLEARSTTLAPGKPRQFLGVQVAGQVHTTPFTVEVTR